MKIYVGVQERLHKFLICRIDEGKLSGFCFVTFSDVIFSLGIKADSKLPEKKFDVYRVLALP
jgi:hypothetical protein